jgi:murein DD-endopeptidase MepM/ murein hydrolase activator NlpD
LEPSLVRRIAAGILVACLIVAAGVLGWSREAASRRAREVDLPARGGSLVNETGRPAVVQAPRPAASRKEAVTVTPSRGGRRTDLVHQVLQGETLFRIARRYGVQVADLQGANGLASDLIRPGQLLMVPGGKGEGAALSLGGTFIWPVLAPVSSNFGPRWGRPHNGIDLAANQGDSIKASRDGEIWLAGTVPGYGETVIVQHADGSRTLYGHCSKLMVKAGQKVKQGQVIALVGSTGQSTGPHLHFEIIMNDRPIDPLLYLPKR